MKDPTDDKITCAGHYEHNNKAPQGYGKEDKTVH